MNWKEFFKPTWRKIFITFILIFIYFLFISLIRLAVVCGDCASIPGFTCENNYYEYLPLKKFTCNCGCTTLGDLFMQYLLFVIIPLLFFYVLSCIIILIYNNFNNSKVGDKKKK